jgi:hypothetical protein
VRPTYVREVSRGESSAHDWIHYDADHRACQRCGLRLYRLKGDREWRSYDWRGVPGPVLLGDGSGRGGWGSCSPPPAPPVPELVIIQYTGHPDAFPGCERVMHRMPEGHDAAIVQIEQVRPPCGRRFAFWEVGPARRWQGWNWCRDCYPEQRPHHVPPVEAAAARAWRLEEQRRELEAAQARKNEKQQAYRAALKARTTVQPKPPAPAPALKVPPLTCLVCGTRTRRAGQAAGLAGVIDDVEVIHSDDHVRLEGLTLYMCEDCAGYDDSAEYDDTDEM